MRVKLFLLLMVFLLSACGAREKSPLMQATQTLEVTLPSPRVNVTRPPDAQAAATAFLDAWQKEDYVRMYAALTPISKEAISEEEFTKLYRDTSVYLTLKNFDFEVLSALTTPSSAQVSYRVTFHTALFGDIAREMMMNLAFQEGFWWVQWEDAMILPELKGGNRLALDYKIPARGNIYDRNGEPIAVETDAVAMGFIADQTISTQYGLLAGMLAQLTNVRKETIRDLYNNAWETMPAAYVPVGEAPKQKVDEYIKQLSTIAGLVLTDYRSRFYYQNGIAPQTMGYMLFISPDQMESYRRQGYRGDEKIGAAGLEKWGEPYLAGKRGATLYVVDKQGQIQTVLAQVESQPSRSIYTTFEISFQQRVQNAISGFNGAAVVLERDTGRVLAIASSPSFNPNLFDPANANNVNLNRVINDGRNRLLNRATQGGYPLGSVFKIITMAAALESGRFTAESTYDCQYEFTELPGIVIEDWTKAKEIPPSGLLTLPEGLMRSCNPWFNHIGLDLYRNNMPEAIPDMARAFGLGSATGIQQIAEDVGSIPDPASEGDAVQLAFGQGAMLATPIQVVDFIAAIGNGGRLLRPQVVEKIVAPDGTVDLAFAPEVRSVLPVSPANLKIVQNAMFSVVNNKRGTAQKTFLNFNVPVYGKTGTAQNPFGDPHAWFAAYTDYKNPERPDIAVVVIAENAGDGSAIAAPIARRIMEEYFFEQKGPLFPWEASYDVTRTPTPLPTQTPIPGLIPTETPTPEGEAP